MTAPVLNKKYEINSQWGPRTSSPEGLASRFLSTVDQLRRADSDLDGWNWYNENEYLETGGISGTTPLSEVRPRMVEAIKENMRRDYDTNLPDPALGYRMPAGMYKNSESNYTDVSINDGDPWSYKDYSNNCARFVNHAIESMHNPVVTFPIFKAVTLILAETWEATWAKAHPNNLVQKTDWDGMKPGWGWMVYVCPHLAKLVTPPNEVIVDLRPNGGLFMAATEEVFDADNPQHIASARLIRDAMRPVTSLEQPFLVPYF
jgi:hypothetical protein